MFELVSFILIFIEKSISFDYPYNFIAIPFISYLVYKKGAESFWEILLVSLLVSLGSISITISIMVGLFYYVTFYIVSTFMAYEKINLLFITLIQAITYSGMIYYETRLYSMEILGKLILVYAVFNYIYMDSGEKLFGVR